LLQLYAATHNHLVLCYISRDPKAREGVNMTQYHSHYNKVIKWTVFFFFFNSQTYFFFKLM